MEVNADSLDRSVLGLFSNLESRMSPEDMKRIVAAYQLAKEAHKGKKEKAGNRTSFTL